MDINFEVELERQLWLVRLVLVQGINERTLKYTFVVTW